jgi:hypothetical protein
MGEKIGVQNEERQREQPRLRIEHFLADEKHEQSQNQRKARDRNTTPKQQLVCVVLEEEIPAIDECFQLRGAALLTRFVQMKREEWECCDNFREGGTSGFKPKS